MNNRDDWHEKLEDFLCYEFCCYAEDDHSVHDDLKAFIQAELDRQQAEWVEFVEDLIGEDEPSVMGGGYQYDEKDKPIIGTLTIDTTAFHRAIERNQLRAELRTQLKQRVERTK